jgi:hypothetical protein
VRKGLATPVCTAGLIDERGLRDYVTHYIHSDPTKSEFGNPASPASTLTACARREGVDLRRNEFLQDYALPRYRVGDLLGSNGLVDGDVMFTFALHRESVLPPFAERDQVALKIALGPLARALRVTYARERALEVLRAARGGDDARFEHETAGVAVLDQHLEVLEASPVAWRVLRELEGTGALDEVLTIAASLVERLRGRPDRTTVEASLLRTAGSRTASIRALATRAVVNGPVTVYIFIARSKRTTREVVSAAVVDPTVLLICEHRARRARTLTFATAGSRLSPGGSLSEAARRDCYLNQAIAIGATSRLMI